jgi:hypothetical protein
LVGFFLVLWPSWLRGLAPRSFQGGYRRFFSWFFFIFALVWTLVVFGITSSEYWAMKRTMERRAFKIVEG